MDTKSAFAKRLHTMLWSLEDWGFDIVVESNAWEERELKEWFIGHNHMHWLLTLELTTTGEHNNVYPPHVY